MEEKLNKLKSLLHEISDLLAAEALLSWDQQTYMPKGAAEQRGEQLSTLARISHIKATSDELGHLLDDLKPYVEQLDPDSNDYCLVKVARRDFEKSTRITPDWVADYARVTTIAHSAWEKAKAESNFSSFRPHLEKVVELRREYANFFTPYQHVYDPLLDDFEPGLKTADVRAIFNELRPQQVALIKAISKQPQVDDAFLHQAFPEKAQWDFGVMVISRFGFDWQRGRQDISVHPFTNNIGSTDARITTHFFPNNLGSSLFGTMHECGHGLYELGFAPELYRTSLASGASLAFHESQSRMYENLVGRSLGFWKYFYPHLQKAFPSQLANVDLMQFYRGINKVKPSLIRIESDEATYNLHIMLRLELEIALMEGKLDVKDLPEAWNARVQEYMGITPPDDAHGVLQDVHWSGGMIGYFPTYALGNLISAQLWQKMQQDVPDLNHQIENGKFAPLLGWLRQNVHRHGAKFEPQDLIQRVTGSKIETKPYVNYLQLKYGEIYGL